MRYTENDDNYSSAPSRVEVSFCNPKSEYVQFRNIFFYASRKIKKLLITYHLSATEN